jgi:DNA-binding NtrC family response regulator
VTAGIRVIFTGRYLAPVNAEGFAVQLFADRFVITGGAEREHRAIDLSTGLGVTVLTSSAGGASDQARWSVRCDWFFRLRHRFIARLVDYGLVGQAMRFEAWRCGEPWRGSRRAASGALAQVTIFLHAIGHTDGAVSADDMRTDAGRPVVLPRSATGYDAATGGSADDLSSCGITIVERPSINAVAEILASTDGSALPVVMLGCVAGAGGSVAIHQLARVARLHGFVPLSCQLDSLGPTDLVDRLDGRSCCLIDRHGGAGAWRSLLDRLILNPRPHVLLSIGAHTLPAVHRLTLERVPRESLMLAVTPAVESGILRRAIERAARRAEGLPARFAELLWGGEAPAGHTRAVGTAIAAERPPSYGDPSASAAVATPVAAPIWPAPAEVAVQRKRLIEALELMESGRHAPAERSLRAVVGGLARRHDWRHAAHGQLALAAALLRRGRARQGREAAAEVRTYVDRGRQDSGEGNRREDLLLHATILTGHARLDEGRLDEAETLLRGSIAAARSTGDLALTASAGSALARCFFWRGHYAEADAALDDIGAAPSADAAVSLEALRSRVAVGRGDIGAAMSHASSAWDRAERTGKPLAVARAMYAVAFAHLAAGDLRGVERDVALCIKAARAGHDPMRALKARLLGAEAARRSAAGGAGERLPQLITRATRLDLPATLRARMALLSDLSNGIEHAVRKHATATGLQALALFAPSEAHQRVASAYDAAIDVLNLCQTGDDDAVVLAEICRRVRARLRAVGIVVFVRDGHVLVPIAADGHSIEPIIAARAVDARQAIPPCQYNERIEGGVPIRYAGETLGALAARWTIAAPPDAARSEMVLTMTATAAATAVSAAMARRRAASATGPAEILGVSGAMAEVRAAVERAGAAPFTILVEGESGAGKELVARALHRRSVRCDRPFCTLNCAALPDDLVDAELFGHSRGAFTGALSDRPGVFEDAHLGTLFLDEVGELASRAQAKVLRTLQDGEVRRVGENTARRVDVRLIAATNRDLRQEVAAGRFRLDLMYRLDVIRITVPPLRERRDDIPLLVEHFWRAATERVGSRAVLSAQTIGALARYEWPGNVRELQNVLAALAVRAPRRGVVPPTALPPAFGPSTANGGWRLGDARRTFEERFIRAALARTGGHRARAAEELGLSRQGLAKLMSRLQIT